MALEPNQLLSKLFSWVFKSKQQLFDADTVAEFMDVSAAEAGKTLKALARDGKLDTHGDWYSLKGAKIETGSIPRSAPPPPIPMKAEAPASAPSRGRKPAPAPVADDEDLEEIVEAPPARRGRSDAPAAKAIAAPKAVAYPELPTPVYTWVIDIADALVDLVQERNRAEVTVADLEAFAGADFADVYPDEQHIDARIHQLLEFFTAKGILARSGTEGVYLAHPVLVEREQSVANKLDRMDVKRATKREYTIECAVPYTGLKGLAVMLYDGQSWLGEELHFPTPEGIPYIEVHHIERIAQGGNESLENLCLLNPFHHKWCHFSTDDEIARMETELKGLVKSRLEGMLAAHFGGAKKTAPAARKTAAAKKAPAKTPAKAPAPKIEKVEVKKAAAKTATKSAAKPAAKKPAAKKTAAKKATSKK